MFERERGGERAVLVDVQIGGSAGVCRPSRSDLPPPGGAEQCLAAELSAGIRDSSFFARSGRAPSGETGPITASEANSTAARVDQELCALVSAAGATVVGCVGGTRRAPDPALFVGTGKADEIGSLVRSADADIVVFNHQLSPAQERNLERLLQCRVIDRVGLILDIFAQRASTFEGKLQVELAQLRHLSTRLVRGWTHLERQKGGIGLRGPGEKQLETDRRLLGVRIRQIRKRLDGVMQRRSLNRRARTRAEVPLISVVGYTNAGKSSLFNQLTGAQVFEADQLFATLDPTLRRVELPGPVRVVMADTVGFVRDLPHELVAAFRATLEETREADLLLHVVDASDANADQKKAQVMSVLEEIGANEAPMVEVYNKVDALPEHSGPGNAGAGQISMLDGALDEVDVTRRDAQACGSERVSEGAVPPPDRIERDRNGRMTRAWVSARTGEGLDALRRGLAERFGEALSRRILTLPPSAGRLRAQLIQRDAVMAEQPLAEGGWQLELLVRPDVLESLCREAGIDDAPAAMGGTRASGTLRSAPLH